MRISEKLIVVIAVSCCATCLVITLSSEARARQPGDRVVAAERFDLLSSDGKIAMSLCPISQGYPGAKITFPNRADAAITLMSLKDGSVAIQLGGQFVGFQTGLMVGQTTGAIIELSKTPGKANWTMGFDSSGTPFFRVINDNGEQTVPSGWK